MSFVERTQIISAKSYKNWIKKELKGDKRNSGNQVWPIISRKSKFHDT